MYRIEDKYRKNGVHGSIRRLKIRYQKKFFEKDSQTGTHTHTDIL